MVGSRPRTVLVISPQVRHQRLYTAGLRRHYELEYAPRAAGGEGRVDAIVYDIASVHQPVDLEWLEALDLPVVVLTPEGPLFPLGDSRNRRVLTYPVTVGRIREALERIWNGPRS